MPPVIALDIADGLLVNLDMCTKTLLHLLEVFGYHSADNWSPLWNFSYPPLWTGSVHCVVDGKHGSNKHWKTREPWL